MRGDEGYTLAEALAALAMIGLAVGGLMEGAHVLGRMQSAAGRHVADGVIARTAAQALQDLFEAQGPFETTGPKDLAGGARQLVFACGLNGQCSARIESRAGAWRLVTRAEDGTETVAGLPTEGAVFAYADARGPLQAWPPATTERRSLAAVSIVRPDGAAGEPIATARLWLEQTPDCQYDPIAQGCRAS